MWRTDQRDRRVQLRKLELPHRVGVVARVVHVLDKVVQIGLHLMRVHVEQIVASIAVKVVGLVGLASDHSHTLAHLQTPLLFVLSCFIGGVNVNVNRP